MRLSKWDEQGIFDMICCERRNCPAWLRPGGLPYVLSDIVLATGSDGIGNVSELLISRLPEVN